MLTDFRTAFDWRAALRQARKRRQMTQARLAQTAGLSLAAVKAYESGARHPSPLALKAIIDSLGLTREEANPILAGAGYAVDWQSLLNARYVSEPERLQSEIQKYPWPSFITNQGIYLVAANRAFEVVWDVDLSREFLDPRDRNFLAGASNERFVRCIENYDELVTFLIGLAKGDPRVAQTLEQPAPWLREAMQRFLEGDPKYIRRFFELWEAAEPLPHRTRYTYDVRWRYRGELPMRFTGILTIADLWDELSWNDWIPADVETWRTLAEITARSGDGRLPSV